MTSTGGLALRRWKHSTGIRIAVLMIAALLTACNSLIAHTGLDATVEPQTGTLYPGVRLNLKSWRCLPSVASGYPPAASAALVALSAVLLVADLPLSLVGDTLMLPIDVAMSPSSRPINWQSAPCD